MRFERVRAEYFFHHLFETGVEASVLRQSTYSGSNSTAVMQAI